MRFVKSERLKGAFMNTTVDQSELVKRETHLLIRQYLMTNIDYFQHLEEEREQEIKSYEARMLKKLSSLADLSREDMHRFMQEHKKDMALYKGMCSP